MPEIKQCVAWITPEGCGTNTHLDPEYSCIERDVALRRDATTDHPTQAACRIKLPRHTHFDVCFSFPDDTNGRSLAPAGGGHDWIGFRIEIRTNWDDVPHARPLVWKAGWLLGGNVKCFNRYRHPLWKPANVRQIELALYPMTINDENGIATPYASVQWEVLEGSRRAESYVHRNLPHGLELNDYTRTGTPAHIFRPGGVHRLIPVASDKKFFVRRDEFWRKPRGTAANGRGEERRERLAEDSPTRLLKRSAPTASRSEGRAVAEKDELPPPNKTSRTGYTTRNWRPISSSTTNGQSPNENATATGDPSAGVSPEDAEQRIDRLLGELKALSATFENSNGKMEPDSTDARAPARSVSPKRPGEVPPRTEDPRLKMDRFKHRAAAASPTVREVPMSQLPPRLGVAPPQQQRGQLGQTLRPEQARKVTEQAKKASQPEQAKEPKLPEQTQQTEQAKQAQKKQILDKGQQPARVQHPDKTQQPDKAQQPLQIHTQLEQEAQRQVRPSEQSQAKQQKQTRQQPTEQSPVELPQKDQPHQKQTSGQLERETEQAPQHDPEERYRLPACYDFSTAGSQGQGHEGRPEDVAHVGSDVEDGEIVQAADDRRRESQSPDFELVRVVLATKPPKPVKVEEGDELASRGPSDVGRTSLQPGRAEAAQKAEESSRETSSSSDSGRVKVPPALFAPPRKPFQTETVASTSNSDGSPPPLVPTRPRYRPGVLSNAALAPADGDGVGVDATTAASGAAATTMAEEAAAVVIKKEEDSDADDELSSGDDGQGRGRSQDDEQDELEDD
ncbi:uncharacterized protein PSFLO_03451 [Pseudozyma flocculosa]|uniref:Uncharacterized protein n=1 Tax=Pseudozyma flocculosa TaxID=84751 RepID=A0A5C3F0C9_9BASI|nr:uncharacterized protein PSFLO_03451 [Pseudozyma flocculosa]